MPKFKIINLTNLRFFGAALLATSATHCFNLSKVEAASAFPRLLQSAEISTGERDLDLVQNNRWLLVGSQSITQSEATLLLAQEADSDIQDADNRQSKTRLMRLVTLSFFLLFFVPLGIFYPLFLFYKMLLIKPEKSNGILVGNREPEVAKSVDLPNSDSQTPQGITKANVSKLQIAFTPPARELRKELSKVSSIADANPDYNIMDLIRQTVEVLIEQGHWTHVSHSSIILPLKKVRAEFDSIANRERHKFTSQQSGLIDYNRNVSSSEGYEINYSYVVVTLIFCTIHPNSLFPKITTKERLVEELVKLGEMEEDSALKFELVWNPQQENIYISNEQLLIEYEDMTRLF